MRQTHCALLGSPSGSCKDITAHSFASTLSLAFRDCEQTALKPEKCYRLIGLRTCCDECPKGPESENKSRQP